MRVCLYVSVSVCGGAGGRGGGGEGGGGSRANDFVGDVRVQLLNQ